MAEISILSNVRIVGALQFDKDFSEFPSNPKVGTLVIKNKCLYGYIKIGELETWYPFAARTNHYIHAQGAASVTWTVNHGLNSEDIWYQVKDASGMIVSPSGFQVIDGNTLQFTFTEAITGTVLVVSTSSMDVPSLRTSLLEIGSDVRIDTGGMTISGERVLTRATMTIGDGSIARFTVNDLQRLNLVSGVGVSLDFNAEAKSITFNAPGLSVTPEYVANEISGVKGSVNTSLNTLAKIAAAINNDASFGSNIEAEIATKLDKAEVVNSALPSKVLRLDATGKLPADITGNAASATSVNWSGVQGRPTTLSGYGITDAFPIDGSQSGTISVGTMVVYGAILPNPTKSIDIGSPTARFKTIYVDEAKLSTNTLYIGDTPILGTSADTINIKADPGQSINMQTRGTGSTLVTSEKGVTVSTSGMNADVVIQTTGAGSKVRFGAPQTIDFTAPEMVMYGNSTVSGNQTVGGTLTVTGNLVVNGSQTTINATTVTTKDNIIVVNSGEQGTGVTSGKAGIQVDRGDEADYQIIFDETDDLFKVGIVGQLEVIASRPWANSTFSALGHGHADANGSSSGFMSAANFTKLAGVENNANYYIHPTGDGNLHVPATGTTNNGKVLKSGMTAGSAAWAFVDWSEIAAKPSTFTPSAHTHGDADITDVAWAKITGKPTTLAGYGITDAVNVSEVVTAATPNKILKLNASGKLGTGITGDADGNAGTATKLLNARTISVSGDATGSASFDGSANSNIAIALASVVTAGTGTKVTYNAKGLVTGSTSLAASDIPSLDWTKIATGKPTTLAGYGITDALNTSSNAVLPLANADVTSASLTTSTTTANQVVDSFSSTAYRTAKYLIQATSGTSYHACEALVIHNGTTASLVVYGDVMTGSSLMTIDADVSGGNVRLLATPANAATTIKVVRTSIDA